MTSKEKTKFRATKAWKDFRAKLIAERNSSCEICLIKKRHGLNVHHHDESDYMNLDPTKFSLVCRDCHQLVEKLIRRKSFDVDAFGENLKRIYLASK